MSDPGLRTPLVDFFMRGEAPRDARLLAAKGALATRALEQLAILVLLQDDADAEIAATARQTMAALPGGQLSAFLGRSDVPGAMKDFFEARGIKAGPPIPGDAPDPMVDTAGELPHVPEGDEKEVSTVITSLPIMDRLKLATKGTREQRAVLIRDPNKLIAVAVLSSPKLTESEVESFARMGNLSEEVLRIIGNNRSWTKNYGVVASLVRNPKTPAGISMHLLARLNDRDMKMLAVDRNVPEGLRLAARKYLVKNVNR